MRIGIGLVLLGLIWLELHAIYRKLYEVAQALGERGRS